MSSDLQEKIDILMVKGEYRKAYELITKNQDLETLSEEDQLIVESKKCLLLRYLGDFDELIKISREVQSKAKLLKKDFIHLDAVLLEIFAHYRLNKVEYVLELIDKAENLLQKLKQKDSSVLKTRLLSYKVYSYITNGDFDQANIYDDDN